MADYHSPTVVQPSIPMSDMTSIEQLLLTTMFESEQDGDALYLFAPVYMDDMPVLEIDEVRIALTEGDQGRTAAFIRDQLARLGGDDAFLQLEDEIPWEAAFQDIVRRSATIEYVEIVTSFTCSKMRADGFGGAVTIITGDKVLSSSTEAMACELLDRAQYGELGCAPGFGRHVLLRLTEENVRSTLVDLFDAEAPPGLGHDDVTDSDIREACFAVREHIYLSHEQDEAVISAATRAMRIAAERKSG